MKVNFTGVWWGGRVCDECCTSQEVSNHVLTTFVLSPQKHSPHGLNIMTPNITYIT